jgi:hypothetical protein
MKRSHGRSETPEYVSFNNARWRCKNERGYVDRGIQFRFNSFDEFLAELGRRPEGTTLDRIDNDGHYESGNVRWATPKQQANNRRQTTGRPRPDLAQWNRENLRGRPGHPQTEETRSKIAEALMGNVNGRGNAASR